LKRITPRGQVNLATFSERLNLSSRALIQLIETLVDRKLVERRRAGRGGPESFLHITSKGEGVLHQVASLNRQELRARAAAIIGALNTIAAH
jgi:DNA-binding MarR family transcriptional regulator